MKDTSNIIQLEDIDYRQSNSNDIYYNQYKRDIFGKKIWDYAQDLLSYAAKRRDGKYCLQWEDIDDEAKGTFVSLFLEEDDRDLFSIYENKNYDDIVSSLIKTLTSFKKEDAVDFAATVKEKMIDYYKNRIMEIIDTQLEYLNSKDPFEYDE